MDANITQSFIDMVEAYKAKPELEAQIASLKADNAMCYGTIDQLRFEIEEQRTIMNDLRTKLSEVTKERDDASFRNLELDEKLSGIEKLLGVAERLEQARKAGIDQAVQAMNEHQATVDAMTPKSEPDQVPEEPQPVPLSEATSASTEVIPDAGTVPTEPKINPYSGFPIHYPDGEYKGQSYYDKPSWVSWAAWVDAGGEPEPWMVR